MSKFLCRGFANNMSDLLLHALINDKYIEVTEIVKRMYGEEIDDYTIKDICFKVKKLSYDSLVELKEDITNSYIKTNEYGFLFGIYYFINELYYNK